MTIIVDKAVARDSSGGYIAYQEIAGDSSETKPTTGIAVGSIFFEVDTGSFYSYSEDQSDWVFQFSLQDS